MPMVIVTKRDDLIHPELSYKIVGAAFNVYNSMGNGHHERCYQQALAEEFRNRHLQFQEQLSMPLKYGTKTIGRNILDFLVENKVVVEIKRETRFSKANIDQVVEYLKTGSFKLAILINFGNDGVKFRRIVNLY